MNELGELRPSQIIYSFGIGSLLDLPNMSVMVMGLDDWDTRFCREITEDRLLAALQKRLGNQVKKLYLPPIRDEDQLPGEVAVSGMGAPVCPFPRWLRCPVCDTLATVESGIFKVVLDPYRPDRSRFIHPNCTKANNPSALPVRFLIACRDGHLSDFPWVDYVHGGMKPCKPSRLTLREYGATGDASDIIVKCIECGRERRMGDAFDKTAAGNFSCPGHHPHLRTIDSAPCTEPARTILLGASNSWFPVVMSVLSIPKATDRVARVVEERWADLKDIPSLDVLRYVAAPSRMPQFSEFTPEQLWAAVEKKRAQASAGDEAEAEVEDLKVPEWQVLCAADASLESRDFKLRRVKPPAGLEAYFEDTILVERIREVRALLGFTRIESKGDFADAAYVDDGRQTNLSRNPSDWLPTSEVRGEGIFLRLKEEKVATWEKDSEVQRLTSEFFESHRRWRRLRKIEPNNAGFPGIRYILLHSLAHALMRQISLDCGYTAASIRERLYCRGADEKHGPMAGILIYTSASDSEGTLGGLVNLGEPSSLGRHLSQAFEGLKICASDPLCAEHRPSMDGHGIHGACCHGCLFAPETSCERGNRYLDRSTLIETWAGRPLRFFGL